MNAELLRRGDQLSFVVLELCSYGETGDYQVLPRKALNLELAAILQGVLADNHKAVLADDEFMALLDSTSVIMTAEGRAVFEGVKPSTKQAAWSLYCSLLEKENHA
jgi:hypothetical protein